MLILDDGSSCGRTTPAKRALKLGMLAVAFGTAAGGCNAFNPAFLSLVGAGGSSTLPNAPGHVVVQFINNAEVNERLLSFLESSEGGGLGLTDEQRRQLRPRIRFRVRLTFESGATQTVEFVDGSSELIDQSFDAQNFPDLNENDLDNIVAVCNVTRVEVLPGSDIEVFIPVQLEVYELQQVTTAGGGVTSEFVLREQIDPQFRALQVDEVDEDLNVTLRRNIDVRDAPAPVSNPFCGSVISIRLEGELSVPFAVEEAGNAPSYDRDDLPTEASIGGRYRFIVSVQ